jgi:predicted acyl esterase
VRLALDKSEGAYGLRDDITQISNFTDHYVPGDAITLDLTFDEHCFLVRAGERLRIDVSSSDTTHYVRHTNQKGLYSLQTTARVAHNTLILADSVLTVPADSPDTPTANEVTCIQ